MNTPHDHDHNDMTPLDHALAHNKQLIEQLDVMTDQRDVAIQCHEWCRKDRKQISAELVEAHDEIMEQARLLGAGGSREAALISKLDTEIKQRELWQQEAKRWRDMYLEYDEMLEGDLEKAKKRITNVISKIKSLEKEMNDEKY
jgi:alkyl sulfatase BDS1-like metallo-beta-lactamase superfamily hydrolase